MDTQTVSSPKSPKLKKSVHMLAALPLNAPLKLNEIDRKLMNVLLKESIDAVDPAYPLPGLDGAFYGISLSDLAKKIGLDPSAGYNHLRQSLDRISAVSYRFESPSSRDKEDPNYLSVLKIAMRTTCSIFKTVTYEFATDLKGQNEVDSLRGRTLMAYWKINEDLKSLIFDPKPYTLLRIETITSLNSSASIALYEICSRYATNAPHFSTGFIPVNWWYEALTGVKLEKSKKKEESFEFKYFARDCLKKAINDVNKNSEIHLEMMMEKDGRRVSALKFIVNQKDRTKTEVPKMEISDARPLEQKNDRLESKALSLGCTLEHFRKLCKQYPKEVMQESIAGLEMALLASQSDPDKEKIRSANGYLSGILKNKTNETETSSINKIAEMAMKEASLPPTQESVKTNEKDMTSVEVESLFSKFLDFDSSKQGYVLEQMILGAEARLKKSPLLATLINKELQQYRSGEVTQPHAKKMIACFVKKERLASL